MADLNLAVSDRVETLQQLDAEAIRSLPELVMDRLPPDGKIMISQYHIVSSSGEDLVIVQGGQDRWFGISTLIVVGGFAVSSNGTKRPLTDEEKFPYE